MNPTPAQLAYIAALLCQLRLRIREALYLAQLHIQIEDLWMLQHRDAVILIHALEQIKRKLGYPQIHLG